MLGFIAFLLAIFLVGHALPRAPARHLDSQWEGDVESLEVFSTSALAGGSVWLAASWTLALTGALTHHTLRAVGIDLVLSPIRRETGRTVHLQFRNGGGLAAHASCPVPTDRSIHVVCRAHAVVRHVPMTVAAILDGPAPVRVRC